MTQLTHDRRAANLQAVEWNGRDLLLEIEHLQLREEQTSDNVWIDAEKQKPPLIDGKDYSANVWGWDGKNILIVSYFDDGNDWHWANTYGSVFGDAYFDDDYQIKYWQPIAIPEPPNSELTGRGQED